MKGGNAYALSTGVFDGWAFEYHFYWYESILCVLIIIIKTPINLETSQKTYEMNSNLLCKSGILVIRFYFAKVQLYSLEKYRANYHILDMMDKRGMGMIGHLTSIKWNGPLSVQLLL